MEGNSSSDGPNNEELIELLEKQDEVVDTLQNQLKLCMDELKRVKEHCKSLEEENVRRSNDNDIKNMKVEIEDLKKENIRLINKEKERDTTDQQKDLTSIMELRLKFKEIEFELEREKMNNESIKMQLDIDKTLQHQLKTELNEEQKLRCEMEKNMLIKLENLAKDCAEWKAKYEHLNSRRNEEVGRLEARLELYVQKEAQLEEHIRQINEENIKTRKEKVAANTRVSALVDETTSLRAKLLKLTNSSNPLDNESNDMKRLLSDQRHLIAALREETKLLATKIEHDSKQYRNSIKLLKREKKDVEDRLEDVLRV